MTNPRRASLAVLLLVAPVLFAADDPAPTLTETVEVREVGVVADLDISLRGLSAAELANRIVVLEGGIARTPMSVAALDSPGRTPYSRVVVTFDLARCDESILASGAAAVGSEAERLVRLGPVDVVRADDRSEIVLRGATDPEAVAKVAAAFGRAERCSPVGSPPTEVPPGFDVGRCESAPCLLVRVGAGWGGEAEHADAARAKVERSAERLAADGWVVLAAPIPKPERKVEGPSIRPPEQQPGTDRHTFGVSVFGSKKKEKMSAEEFDQFVDLWLAPLRRLSSATAGELATTSEELAAALDRLGRRSILWYRTERSAGAAAPALELREASGNGRRIRSQEWAPSLSK